MNRQYESYKESKVQWIGKIPKHWKNVHIKRVCNKIQTGSTPPTSNSDYYKDGTIPWYSPGCYNATMFLDTPTKMINNLAYQENKLRIFPSNSIFMIGIGATIGKSALIKTSASCNQQITALICNYKIFSVFFAFQLKIYEKIIPKISQFTTLPIVDQVKIGSLQIALPTIKEQRFIAKYLDKTCISIDTTITIKQKQLEALDALKKSIIHKAATQGLDDSVEMKDSGSPFFQKIPIAWENGRLKNLTTKIGSGITPRGGASEYIEKGIPLLRSQNIHYNGLALDDIANISEEIHQSMANSKVMERDVLLNITGASLGRCHYLPDGFGEANVNQHVCIIRTGTKLYFKYLFYFLYSDAGQKQIFTSFRGSSREGLNFREIKGFSLT